MKTICTIHDTKAEVWGEPFYVMSNGQAVRAFADAARGNDTDIGKHPEDYNLYKIGEWDERTGAILAIEPVHLIAGANVKEIT